MYLLISHFLRFSPNTLPLSVSLSLSHTIISLSMMIQFPSSIRIPPKFFLTINFDIMLAIGCNENAKTLDILDISTGTNTFFASQSYFDNGLLLLNSRGATHIYFLYQ